MQFWTVQAINGVSYGMLLFLLAVGLSVILGLMRIANLAHGSYYLVGFYVGLTFVRAFNDFLLAIVVAAVTMGVLGALMQMLLLRRLGNDHLAQVLLTFGFTLAVADICMTIWDRYPLIIQAPPLFRGSLTFGELMFPTYRLLVIGVGLVVAIFLWWFQEATRIGAGVRAAVDDEEMCQTIGLNVPLRNTAMFGMGAALAGAAGVVGGPLLGGYPGLDVEVLVLALVVVIVGGMGSLRGVFVGALVVGLLDNYGKALFPEFSLFAIFAPMAIILAIKPQGIFGGDT